MMTRLLVVLALISSGCSSMTDMDAGTRLPFDAGPFDAGPQPIRYTQFTRRTDGWPAGATLVGAAVVNGVLYAATDQGVVKLSSFETRWETETTPLTGDLKPTSLLRDDQTLVMTTAGATGGTLFQKEFDGAWAQVSGPPPNPEWALVKKSNDWLLATTGGLYVAPALTGPWTRRSQVGTMLFTRPISRLVAASAQQKLFAAQVDAGLSESSDVGATWSATAGVTGRVEALAASGAVVLVSSATSGQQRSDNYGNTFRPATNPLDAGVRFFVAEGTTFWAGANDGLKRSDDQGVSFVDDLDGLPSGTVVTNLIFAGSYVLAMTAEGPWLNQVP